MWKVLSLAALLATGCGGASLGSDQTGDMIDSGTGGNGSGSDSGTTVVPDAAVTPACANGRQLYLAFDGVTLTQGTPSDATQNRVSWMSNATATIPPYRQGDGNRAMVIATIIDEVKLRLAATPISVVTQRPLSGPYVMVVFGGTNTNVGTIYTFATGEHDCGDVVKSDVGWISDAPAPALVSDLVIGTIGWGLGLNGTTDPNDCMCGWANSCNSAAGACTLSASIATTASAAPATTCAGQNPQNEVAAFTTGFCQ